MRHVPHAASQTLYDRNFVHLVMRNSINERWELVWEEIRGSWWKPSLHVWILFVCHHEWRFDRHSASSARRTVIPHVGSHMNFQVSFCRESFATYVAFERFIAGMGSDMNLQSASAREAFLANLTLVLQWSSS